MKLFVVLSLIACSYADKLDRTYLPPSSAASAGGSPGPLDAPVGPSGPAGFGQPAANSGFSQPAANSGYGQPAANSGYGQPAANSGFGQPAASGPSRNPTFGKSTSGPAFGSQPSGFAPSTQYGQPGSPAGSIDPGFGVVAQNFGPGAQDYQRSQPQRAQASADQSAQILRSDSQNDGETFSYSFETSNGIAAEESGVATNGVQAQGAFSYSDDDGQNFRVTYTADENGFQPQGDHLPTPHPIPEDILKSIEKNAQAAAAGIQEGAYNPNEDSSAGAPQQYNYNAPTSYSQGSSGSGSFNQQGSGPNKFYGAPNAGIARPQSGRAQDFQPQGPSQQYQTSNDAGSGAPSNGYGQPQQAPSPSYGSPSNGLSGAKVPSQAGPNQFQQQGPSQQYNAPRPAAGRSNGFGPSTNGFAPSGSTSQSSQYQAPSGVPSAGRSQGSAQVGQAQDDNGYQYDRPQGSFGASGNKPSSQGPTGRQSFGGNQGSSAPQGFGGNQGSASQYRPQNGGGQPASAQSSFPKPTGNAGYPTGRAQGSFGASSGPSSQGSYGSTSGSNTGAVGPSSSQGSFGPNTNSPRQGAYGAPSGQGSAFGSSASNGQSSSSANGFGRVQGSFGGAKASMPDAGYSYNRPGSQGGVGPQGNGGSQPQGGANAPGTFGAPRQPPSFSEEEGYKY